MKNAIAKVVIGLPVEGPFDYKIPEDAAGSIKIGQRVMVPFGRRHEMGYIIGFAEDSKFSSLKIIHRVLDQEPVISSELLQLAYWMSAYYGCSLGEAVERMVPFSVRNRKKLGLKEAKCQKQSSQKSPSISVYLSHDSQSCFEKMIKQAEAKIKARQGVLFLAPDHVTSQRLFEQLSSTIDQKVARLDLGTSKHQIEYWISLKNGEVHCAVGLRAGVFAPVTNLGLVVVFDEQHYGYKEDQMPFYHARDVILKRAEIEQSDVIFVTTAPTVELWSLVASQRCKKISFPQQGESVIRLIDLTNYKPRRDSALSFPVANAVGQALDQGKKVLIVFNRRGSHTLMKCNKCGHVLKCDRCEALFIYHEDSKKMVCPSCDQKYPLAQRCPNCREDFLHRYGEGIERVESGLAKFFPQAKLATFDRDTNSVSKSATILVATQAVFKVLDKLAFDIVVVLDVDAELSRHDYRCHQNVFSFLMDLKKVAGSAVFVQTRQPLHPALRYAKSMDMTSFYQNELSARQELGFPPFQHLFELMIRGKKEELVIEQADMIYEQFLEHELSDFEAMPPQPSYQAKLRDQFRYTIMGKGADVEQSMAHIKKIIKAAKKKRGVIVTINVDP